MRHEADHREDYETSKHWSTWIHSTHDQGVFVHVISELIVAAQSDQRTQTQAVREEDLGDSVDPYFRLHQFGHVGHHVELDALHGAGEGDSSDQQHSQQEVWEQGGEVDHLAGPPDSLPDAEVAQHPHQQQGSSQLPTDVTNVLDTARDLKSAALPELLDRVREHSLADVLAVEGAEGGHVHGGPAGQVLTVVGVHAGGGVPVVVAGTPWYVWSHGHEEVEDGPGEDHDIVDVHPARHHSSRVADTFEDRSNLKDTQTADGKHLSHGQLHEEHRNTSEEQGEEVGNEERAAAIFVAKVGEPPNVAEADGQANDGEDEV